MRDSERNRETRDEIMDPLLEPKNQTLARTN